MTETTERRNMNTRVKICGLTNFEDAQVACAAGADLLGFVFYQQSPRSVDPRTVASIVGALKSASRLPLAVPPLFVGVFVDPTLEQVVRTLDYCGLDLAQLHGDEDPAMLASLVGRAFKALRPRSIEEAQVDAARYAVAGRVGQPELLLDAYHPQARGGVGQVGDWSLAAGLARRYHLLLAGGLTPENVGAAVRQVQPWGVDVASGVEAAPGRKDPGRIRAFVEAVRSAARDVAAMPVRG